MLETLKATFNLEKFMYIYILPQAKIGVLKAQLKKQTILL